MKTKTIKFKIYAYLALTVAALAAAVTALYAWFYVPHDSIYLVDGDIEVSVRGWYRVATAHDITDGYLTFDDTEDALQSLNDITGVSNNEYIAFKFEIINKTERDGLLSLRFSHFGDSIFENYAAYAAAASLVPKSPLDLAMTQSAKANTAKLAYDVDDFYWGTARAMPITGKSSGKNLWKFSAGEAVAENLVLPRKVGAGQPMYLYFRLIKNQSSIAIEEYRAWLCGTDGNIGYGQQRCARLNGYLWEAFDQTQKAKTDAYLSTFIEKEIQAINPDITEQDGISELNLTLNYFEFTVNHGKN